MTSIYILPFLILGLYCSVPIIAQEAKSANVASGAKHIKILESFSQRTLPGAPGMRPSTQYHFILTWRETEAPATFLWRGDHTWMMCAVQKVHKANKKTAGEKSPSGFSYNLEEITKAPLRKGDTLEISPIAGGKYAIPAELPQDAMNILYFKTAKGKWQSFPVKEIKSLPDIALP